MRSHCRAPRSADTATPPAQPANSELSVASPLLCAIIYNYTRLYNPEGDSMSKLALTLGPSSNGHQISSNLVKSRQILVTNTRQISSSFSRPPCQIRQRVKLDPRAGPLSKWIPHSRALCQIRPHRRPISAHSHRPTPRCPSQTIHTSTRLARLVAPARTPPPSVKSCQIPVKFLSNSADASRPSVKSPSNPRPLHARRARRPSKFRGRPALCQIPSMVHRQCP